MRYWLFYYIFSHIRIYILNFFQNFYFVIIHWKIDGGIGCFLWKVLNFDIFGRGKSWVPFECNPCWSSHWPNQTERQQRFGLKTSKQNVFQQKLFSLGLQIWTSKCLFFAPCVQFINWKYIPWLHNALTRQKEDSLAWKVLQEQKQSILSHLK